MDLMEKYNKYNSTWCSSTKQTHEKSNTYSIILIIIIIIIIMCVYVIRMCVILIPPPFVSSFMFVHFKIYITYICQLPIKNTIFPCLFSYTASMCVKSLGNLSHTRLISCGYPAYNPLSPMRHRY